MNASSRSTLVVTNDFPPRRGGIERFAWEVVRRLPAGSVVVHTARQPGARDIDAELGRRGVVVVRDPSRVLLPTPATTARVAATAREHGCDRAWFVAAAPLGLMAPALRRAGVKRTVASTHGHEVWWASLPGSRTLLRAIGERNDIVTAVAQATSTRIATAMPGVRLVGLPPGVDPQAFSPASSGLAVRARWGLGARPVVVFVSRLVKRKGAEVLVTALPAVRAAVPGAALLVVGDGPRRRAVERAARRVGLRLGVGGDVVLTGALDLASGELPEHYAAGTVFAMPARDLLGGLQPEALGICYLEAAASGLAVVAGRSGGTGEAVLDGVTGLLVDGGDPRDVSGALIALLTDPERAGALGAAGRERVMRDWSWDQRTRSLAQLLDPTLPVPGPRPQARRDQSR